MPVKKKRKTRSRKKQRPKKKNLFRTLFLWCCGLAMLAGAGIVGLVLLVRYGVFGPLPDKEVLANVEHYEASVVYSADKRLLGSYYVENRTTVSVDSVPDYFIDALIATEDARFYNHDGIDYRSWGRVLIRSVILRDRSSGGGSTITQQLAKNLFPRKRFGYVSLPINKIREIIIAMRLERVYSKRKILQLYLNTVSFGENTYGIGFAAQRFFGVAPNKLNIEQSAMLVGMLKATSTYNPLHNQKRALQRRNVVLSRMATDGYIKPNAYDSLSELPLQLNYKKITHHQGPAPYFREHLRVFMDEWCKNHKNEDGEPYDLYSDGLKIYTTIDYEMQSFAEEAIASHMAQLQDLFNRHWKNRQPWDRKQSLLRYAIRTNPRYKEQKKKGLSDEESKKVLDDTIRFTVFDWQGEHDTAMTVLDSIKYHLKILQCGFAAIDPSTGKIKVWAGGINHKYFQYDHVTSKRQAGSIFKPIVYATAIENGVRPCDRFPNDSIVYGDYEDWNPSNADGEYAGWYSVKGALTNSVNTVAVQLLLETGIGNVISKANAMNISSKILPDPSIALGTPSISLLEIITAFSVFANGGYPVEPYFIDRIETKNGKVLQKFKPKRSRHRVLKPETVIMMNEMLQDVVDRGTAASLRSAYGIKGDIAGKTGTTQEQSDGWFIGFTPALVAGAWVGADNPSVHFRTLHLGQGAKTALPIWAKFYKKLVNSPKHASFAQARFKTPPDSIAKFLDCQDYYEEDEIGILQRMTRRDESVFEMIKGLFRRKKKEEK